MGQRSQIYVRINGKLMIANYYQWNYGDGMVSRARGILEYLKHYQETRSLNLFTSESFAPEYPEKLRRICDTDFFGRDVQIGYDLVKGWQKEFPEEQFNAFVFEEQDNNDGKLFIDITDETAKYCFYDGTPNGKPMTVEQYMKWDYLYCREKDWTKPTEYHTQEQIDNCKKDIAYINEHAELMTADELREYINADYEQGATKC